LIPVSVRNLQYLFRPRSVALVGASTRERSLGATVLRNLLEGGFSGPVLPVNPRYGELAGLVCYPGIDRLPQVPDLAVVCTPPAAVPGIIEDLGRLGTRAAVVLTAGLGGQRDGRGRTLREAMVDAARPHLLRILGPNCVGLLVPGIGLNASFAHTSALPGELAMVAQSGALTTAMLDWARSRGIGFSHFISLGDAADVDFGDVIDYLGSDGRTRAILLYVEAVSAARKFMSAARAASRNKPLIVVKSGRFPAAAKAAASHTGALAGADEVYDAAIRRAGMLRVDTTEALFAAAETLARARPIRGERLAILTNGGGPGVMATDALVAGGGVLASLAPETLERLDAILPPTWSRGNPVDIIGDAPAERYAAALEVLLAAREVDSVLLIHAPTAIVPSADIARACAAAAAQTQRTLLTCWMGGEGVRLAERMIREAGIPTYATPEEAVRGFLQLVEFRRNQDMLMEVPPAAPAGTRPDCESARRIVKEALDAGRLTLSEPEAKAVLEAYGIPVVPGAIAAGVDEALTVARRIGFPVVLKIVSPDITHKSDVGGVALNIKTEAELRAACAAMLARCAELRPNARLDGFHVQSMLEHTHGHELIAGVATDNVFGPVILFGEGGTAVEIIRDQAVTLPPLNAALARQLVFRTRVSRLLEGYRDRPPINFDALYGALVRLSELTIDLPQVDELDINPLLADERGVCALDVRLRLNRACGAPGERLAIRPYPVELEDTLELGGRTFHVRPIRPEDEPGFRKLLALSSPEDIQSRFFHALREMPRSELARYTQIDYDREMALVALTQTADGTDIVADARALADPDNERAEFAVMVRSDLHSRGLGHSLMERLIAHFRKRGTAMLYGDVLPHNTRMLELARNLGFVAEPRPEDQVVSVTLHLVARPRDQL
jgi:acetyltransferase